MEGWDLRALAVLERLNAAGHRAVLVGGCVRDRLMGRTPHDYDAATSARPEQIREACAPMRVVETGVRHGTVTVLSGGLPVEVTTFRREGRYTDHRRPDRVEFTGDLGEDLARRDFTINAMAWEPSGLTDPFGGRADLAAGVIRCVGEPERRFGEDALRLLRALRFAAQLDFRMEEGTAAGVRACAPQLACVSRERVAEELKRLVCGPAAGREELRAFHDQVYEGYAGAFGSRRNAMLRMKEVWFYLIHLFGDSQRHAKAIRKARDTGEYESAVAAVFRELELLPELRPEW